uniref:Glutaredoxin domain-containing protein n=1 Tax=Panagrolaimus sp. JU765 TaxID=591449 RepID=A0AC34QNY7_9BILA
MLANFRGPLQSGLITRLVQRTCATTASDLKPEVRKRIDEYVKGDPVVVFMKGTKQQPMCGFSRNVKLVLDYHEVTFKDYNVLEDDELREGVKKYSDWPTIPQVYVNSQFVGGGDVLVEMHKDGEITDFFDKNGIPSKFSDTLKPK